MRTRSLQAIRHVGFEDLGSFEAPLRQAGYDIEYVDVAERDIEQLDPLRADLLVVLGGPIGVNDRAAYPVVTQEVALLKARLAADRPTLGICLGAQLMAAALGARVFPGPSKEIGWFPLEVAQGDAFNPLAALLDIPVLHWHGDTFDLPEGCKLCLDTGLPQPGFRTWIQHPRPAVPSRGHGCALRALAIRACQRVGDGRHRSGRITQRCPGQRENSRKS